MAEETEKKPKKKREKKRKSTYYKIEGNELKRTKKPCPKCGAGIFLAEHKDRFVCGKCSYTKWK